MRVEKDDACFGAKSRLGGRSDFVFFTIQIKRSKIPMIISEKGDTRERIIEKKNKRIHSNANDSIITRRLDYDNIFASDNLSYHNG